MTDIFQILERYFQAPFCPGLPIGVAQFGDLPDGIIVDIPSWGAMTWCARAMLWKAENGEYWGDQSDRRDPREFVAPNLIVLGFGDHE